NVSRFVDSSTCGWVHPGDAMQVGQRNPLGTVTFTSIDFAAHRQTGVAALLQEGHKAPKVRKVILLHLTYGEVKLNRIAAIVRRQLRGVVNPILVGGIQNRAAGDIALKSIRLVEQGIEYKDATRRIAFQAAIRGNGAIVRINKRDDLLRQGI